MNALESVGDQHQQAWAAGLMLAMCLIVLIPVAWLLMRGFVLGTERFVKEGEPEELHNKHTRAIRSDLTPGLSDVRNALGSKTQEGSVTEEVSQLGDELAVEEGLCQGVCDALARQEGALTRYETATSAFAESKGNLDEWYRDYGQQLWHVTLGQCLVIHYDQLCEAENAEARTSEDLRQALSSVTNSIARIAPTSRPPLALPSDSPPRAERAQDLPGSSADDDPRQVLPTLTPWLQELLDAAGAKRRGIQDLASRTTELLDWARRDMLLALDTTLAQEGVRSRILPSLAASEIALIEPVPGRDASDGRYHEEIAQGAVTEECPAGHVVRTVERGYMWRDIVLRKAKVVVASERSDADQHSPGG